MHRTKTTIRGNVPNKKPDLKKETEPVVHIVIPDTQAKDGVPTDHLNWIGMFIVEEYRNKNIKIIHLGDHADMPALSMYDKGKKSMEGRRVKADIDAANEAWRILNQPIYDHNLQQRKTKHAKWNPERHILLGNHEDRINRATENDAQIDGLFSTDDLDYARTGWKVSPFKKILWLDGVAYSHFFYNPMTGNPYGGTIDGRLKSIGHSFTMGHQQTLLYGLRYVNGDNRDGGARSQHGLVAGACYLHDENYKGPQGNAHWRGIIVKHQVSDGSYDPMFVSLDYLCRRYENSSLSNFMLKKYPNLKMDE